MARPVFISHRGGASSSTDSGNFVGYVASAQGGRADLWVVITNGVVQPATPKVNRDWEFFDYAAGPLTLGNGGYGWNAAVCLPVPYLNPSCEARNSSPHTPQQAARVRCCFGP
jgi:hypothetical protein